MIIDVGLNGCVTIVSASDRNTAVICEQSFYSETEMASQDIIPGGPQESLMKYTGSRVHANRADYEGLFVEVQRPDEDFVNVPIVTDCYPGTLSVTPSGGINYQTRVWVYDELPGHRGGKIKVPSPNNPQPGAWKYFSRDQVVAIVQQALKAAAKIK